MSGRSRKDAARDRLISRSGNKGDDAALANDVLTRLFATVEKRGPLSEDEANAVVSDETQRMRDEKRGRDRVSAGHRR